MAERKEDNEKEEREFQLELLRVQIEHQDIWSAITLFIAILFSAMVSLATTYLGFYFMSRDPNFGYMVLTILATFIVTMFSILHYFRTWGARAMKENVQKELDNIREKFRDTRPIDQEETKREKKNIKRTEEIEEKKSMSKYERLTVLFAVINIILAGVLTGLNLSLAAQTNQMRAQNLEFQSMMYNFTSLIVAKPEYADLETPSHSSYDNGTIEAIYYGHLDTELQVITPHYGKVSVRYKHFNVDESKFLDQEKGNETTVSFASESDKYEHLVVLGLNQLSNHIDLKALVYFDPDSFSPETTSVRLALGRLFLEAELLDIQTNSTLTKEFSTPVIVEYEPLS